jgi:DNA-binding transcriptional MocR family regulator
MTSPEMPQGTAPDVISLLLGHPDPQTLLPPQLREAMQVFIKGPEAFVALQYGPEQGTGRLIEFLVEKVRREVLEGSLPVQPENLMVVAGSTHAVDMLTRLYAGCGGTVLVEAPTYVDALHIFRDHRVDLYAVPMDEDGLIPDELARLAQRLHAEGKAPGLLYTVPNFHNPTGITLPEARRRQIIKLARQYNMLIVEDDVYHDLSFEGNVPPSFFELAQGKQVASIGSFSKTLAPGLRLGWLLSSQDIIERCVGCGTSQMGGGANPFIAHMVAEYCRGGAWEEHIASLRSLYATRRDAALSALERHMPDDVQWTHPGGGFFIWIRLPEQVFARDVKQLALDEGVAVAAGEGFFVNPSDGEHHLRLAFSRAALADIDAGIGLLARAIERARVGRLARRPDQEKKRK